jgi:spore maturation protein CgeB
MKILLTTNKTLSNGKTKWIDGGYYNVYLPLKDLGHEVYFWDTVEPEEPNYRKVIDQFKPDLIFSCLTGNTIITPAEPIALESIAEETPKGNIKTFNWFCDDTWRFDDFSSKACQYFTACSTPEPEYVQRYKDIGYNNILVGGWHVNDKLHPDQQEEKIYDITFVGQINNEDRKVYLNHLIKNGIKVGTFHGLSQEEMAKVLRQSKIGINFSKNYTNKSIIKTQMKLRPFEIASSKGTMVLSEYHNGLEYFFDVNKEIVCFEGCEEMLVKSSHLINNDKLRNKIAEKGNKRFKKEHTSHERLSNILREVQKI